MTELNTTASAPPFEPLKTELAMDDVALKAFLSHTHKRRYPAKTDVFRPGDQASTLFYVISGSLTINTEVNPGEFIGEMGLFFKVERREVVLRTKGPCELAEIGYESLRQLFTHQLAQDGPKIMFAIGAQISKRLLETSRKASRLAHLDVANRILRTLHDLSREPDAIRHPDGMQLKVSRQELARITGCSREMAGRVLKQLQQKNLLTARGKTIVLFGSR
jgi:CRP/FNR family cyclic AMP-dependent transcriptional regulator